MAGVTAVPIAQAYAPLQLSGVRVDPPVVLAPMAGVTNAAFRSLCREQGAAGVAPTADGDPGLYVCEMLTSRGLVEGDATTLTMLAFDTAAPDSDVLVHALRTEDGGGGFCRNQNGVAAAVEPAHDRPRDRLQPFQMVIREIGVEAGVNRGYGGDTASSGPGDHAVGHDVGTRDMHDVRSESSKVALDPRC